MARPVDSRSAARNARMFGLRHTSFASVALVLASFVSAQTQLFSKNGAGDDELGKSIDFAGDVDGDGHADLIYGAPNYAPGSKGYAEIVSPATGAILRHWDGTSLGGEFGANVANVGDYDGDGRDDFAITSDLIVPTGFGPGRVRVYSGATGAQLVDLQGASFGAQSFGASVAGVGDLDGDGRTELLIGAWTTSPGGRAFVISSIDSHALFVFDAQNVDDGVGYRVAALGDVDGDHVPDFAIAAPAFHLSPGSGRVDVRSGANGAVIRSFAAKGGAGGKELFGMGMRAAGDVDGDAVTDLIIGAPGASPSAYVQVVSARTGALLYEFAPTTAGDNFGVVVASAGDVEGDGRADLIVVDGTTRSISLRSGASGLELYHFSPASIGSGGIFDAVGIGDVDGDGFADFAIGDTATIPLHTPGRLRVYRGFDCPISTYCTAKTNSAGCAPRLSFSGIPSASSSNGFVLRATGELNHKFGSFFYGLSGEQSVPFEGGTLCVAPPLRFTGVLTSGGSATSIDCSGSFAFDFAAYRASGVDPLLVVGAQVDGQFWSRDPGFARPDAANLTAGVRFTICPR